MSLGEEEEGEEEREAQVQEGGRGEPPPEESKLSRLFYLQLYSSVLNAEKAHKKREKEKCSVGSGGAFMPWKLSKKLI